MINIYKITNKITDKNYIGKTKKDLHERLHEHYKSSKRNDTNSLLHKAIRKYGIDNFEIQLIVKIINEDANLNEIKYIKEYKSFSPYGYNLTKGGDGGLWTRERKESFSKYQKKFGNNPEERKRRSERNIERYKDPKQREKTALASKNRQWINNTKENKFIKKCELSEYLEKGWVVGKIDFIRKNKIIVNNGNNQIWINKNELKDYISNGWIRGSLKSKYPTMWIHKGDKEKRIRKKDIDLYPDWFLGRKKKIV